METPTNDIRERFFDQVVKDKSFIDVGGIYGIVREKVSVARRLGAGRVALLDLPPASDASWDQMRDHLAKNNVTDCEFLSGDVQRLHVEPRDVVHCSGVLYHVPNMLGFVAALRKLTKEHCILSTTVMPTSVEVDGESLTTMDGAAVFLPGLAGKERDIFVKYWQRWGAEDITFAEPQYGGHRNLANFFPNWWIPTVGAFKAIATCAGFTILDEGYVEGMEPVAYALLLR